MKKLILLSFVLFVTPLYSEEPNNLDELLEQVKRERILEKEELLERESKFKNAHSKQKKIKNTKRKSKKRI